MSDVKLIKGVADMGAEEVRRSPVRIKVRSPYCIGTSQLDNKKETLYTITNSILLNKP